MNMETVKKWFKTKKARRAAGALLALAIGTAAAPYIGPGPAIQAGAILGGMVAP